MSVLQQLAIGGLVMLGLIGLGFIWQRILREGLSSKGGGSGWTRTPFDTFAECIPFHRPRLWAIAYFAAYAVFLGIFVLSSGR